MTLAELKKQIAAGKGEAQRIFDAELKRLAGSPATHGDSRRLGRYQLPRRSSSALNHRATLERQARACQQICRGARWQFEELRFVTGVRPRNFLRSVRAALAAGQLISFRSPFSDILAEAVASALGQPVIFCADVPAGLLDPVDWNSLLDDDQKKSPIILQAANRSDISLVLGSMRVRLFREAIGFEKPSTIVLITLEARAEMRVEDDVPFGPIIDDQLLKFQGLKRRYSHLFVRRIRSSSCLK